MSHVGCQNHQSHPKLNQEEITYPTKLFKISEKTLLDDIGKNNGSYGISINVLYEKKGIRLDRHKVEYRYVKGFQCEERQAFDRKRHNKENIVIFECKALQSHDIVS